jgi:hypothetical protein
MSWMVTDLPGSPLTWKDPFSHSRSATDTSSMPAAMIRALSRTLRATSAAAAPDTGVDRLPYVPSPNGVLSVSPCSTSMSSGGMPISSATICANVVS